jgi:PAS domain S-box-containing protein
MQPETIFLYSIHSVISNFHLWFVGSTYLVIILVFIGIYNYWSSIISFHPAILSFSKNINTLSASAFLIVSSDNSIKRKNFKADSSELNSFFYNSPLALLRVDSKGNILLFNNAFCNLIEISETDIEKFNYINNKIRDYFGSVKLKYFIEDKVESQIETTWQLKGKVIHVKEFIKIVNINNAVVFDVTIEDISDKKRSERVLQINEEKFKAIIDQVPVGIYKVINTGEFIFANQHLANLIGFSSVEQLKGHLANEFIYNIAEYNDHIQ